MSSRRKPKPKPLIRTVEFDYDSADKVELSYYPKQMSIVIRVSQYGEALYVNGAQARRVLEGLQQLKDRGII